MSLPYPAIPLRFCANLLGELCGLMGESGSGKTTLLNVLGGRALYGKVQGRVNLNRRRYEPERIKLGFVPQAYLIFKELTVWENLWYAARHRVSLKTATTYEIARAVLQSLELPCCEFAYLASTRFAVHASLAMRPHSFPPVSTVLTSSS